MIEKLATAAGARLAVLTLGLIFQIVLAKAMSPEQYAIYAVSLGGSILFVSLVSLALPRAIARFLPELIIQGDRDNLTAAIVRYFICRAVSILIGVGVTWVVLEKFPITANSVQEISHVLILAWFSFNMLQADSEAILQSQMRHDCWSLISFLELLFRVCATVFVWKNSTLDAESVIVVWLATSMIAVVASYTFALFNRHHHPVVEMAERSASVNTSCTARTQFSYMLGIYVSSCAWLATSPAAIRIVSAISLPVVPLAATSFIQGLIASAQRALPVHLLASQLEPVLIGNSAMRGNSMGAQLTLSLLVKIETILVLTGVCIITPMSATLLEIIANPEFAPYGYAVPVFLLHALGTSYYRALEIIAGISLKYKVMMLIAPMGLLCLLLIVATTPYIGILSVLIWPSVELLARLVTAQIMLRSHGAAVAIDFPRLLNMFSAAAVIVAISEFVLDTSNLGFIGECATGSVAGVAFVASLLATRPIRVVEYDLAAATLPKIKGLKVVNLRYFVR